MARYNQKAEQRWDQLMTVAEQLAKVLGPAFLQTVQNLKGQLPLSRIEDLLSSGGPDAVSAAMLSDPSVTAALRNALQQSLVQAAINAAGMLPPAVDVLFDQYNPQAVKVVQEAGATLVREVTDALRDSIRQTVSQSLIDGINPRETARDIRDYLGLTQRQQQAVSNFRSYLEQASSTALDRELRDRRFDRTVQAAIDGKIKLKASQIDTMVERYQQRYLAYRAETIARTEALEALHAGQRMVWEQAFSEGKADRNAVRQYWHVARDERVCPICAPIPELNLDGVAFDEAFQTPVGPVEGPTMHPDCRCVVFTRF